MNVRPYKFMNKLLVYLTSLLTFVMTSASMITMNMITIVNSTISKSSSPANYSSTVMLLSYNKTNFKDKIAKDGSALVSLKSLVFRTSLNDF